MQVEAIAIGDTHFPFTNKRSLRTILRAVAELKPRYVIQLGDLYDQFCASKFPRSQCYIRPDIELSRGQKMATTFWETIRKSAPKAKLHQIIGNHDERAKKRILEVAPSLEPYLAIDQLYKFDGVETQPSERDGLILNGVLYMHGFRSKLGDHARHAHMPVICGHTHRGGTAFLRLGSKTIWELNCGFIGDTNSKPLQYSKQRLIATTTQGFGIVQRLGSTLTPTFVPLPN